MHIRNSFVIHTVGTQTPLKCETVLTHCRCDLICVAFTALQRVFFFFAKRVRQKDLVVFYFEVYSFLCLCARLLFFLLKKTSACIFYFCASVSLSSDKMKKKFLIKMCLSIAEYRTGCLRKIVFLSVANKSGYSQYEQSTHRQNDGQGIYVWVRESIDNAGQSIFARLDLLW